MCNRCSKLQGINSTNCSVVEAQNSGEGQSSTPKGVELLQPTESFENSIDSGKFMVVVSREGGRL